MPPITDELVQRVKGYESDDKGIQCHFYDIGEGIGIKVYKYEDERDKCYRNQRVLARRGLAPNVVGRRFTINGQPCYATKVVWVLRNIWRKELGEYNWLIGDRMREQPEFIEKFDVLHKKLRAMGFLFPDAHPGNIGVLDDGSYVVIDTDLNHDKDYT